MFLISTMSVALSSIYAVSAHPVLLLALILTQAFFICLMLWLKIKFSWMSYILFLIFLGGLMVLFIYIVSLASNEVMNVDRPTNKIIVLVLLIGVSSLFVLLSTQNYISCSNIFSKAFFFMYSTNNSIVINTAMIYLLFTLIVVVKVSNKFNGPVKNLTYQK